MLAERFCTEAKRDAESGKILRKPFLLQICNSVDEGIKTENHASRFYNTWVKYATVARGEDLTEAKMHRPGGPGHWLLDTFEPDGGSSVHKSDIAEFKSRFESGKTAILHDEEVSKWLAVELFFWLESRAKTVAKTAPHSHKEDKRGQFVSPKTNGAERDETDGKFGIRISKDPDFALAPVVKSHPRDATKYLRHKQR